MKKKLTVKEAAELIGISPSLVYQFCDERRVSHYRVGGKGKRGKILLDVDDLLAALEAMKVEAHNLSNEEELPHIR